MQRGKYVFWALVVLAAFVFTYSLYVPVNFNNHQLVEYPNTAEDCLRECLFLSEPISDRQFKESEVKQTQSAALTNGTTQTHNESATRENITAAKPDTGLVKIKGRTKFKFSQDRQELIKFWKSCPKPGQGLESTFITANVDGRLGNVVWAYLTVIAAAKRHGLRPVIDDGSHEVLCKVFNRSSMSVPTYGEMDKKCNTNYFNVTARDGNKHKGLGTRKDIFKYLEEPLTEGYRMLKYGFYVTNSEETIPYWHELRDEIVLRDEYVNEAASRIARFTAMHNKYLDELFNTSDPSRKFEYVGVHARRTDYAHHMSVVHPGSELADERYFHKAIEWMAKTIKNPLIFIVVSDDAAWVQEKLVNTRNDTFMGGNSDTGKPGMDLALLGACNHTIFAYGTFALTGALLADTAGGLTMIYDPRNRTLTKVMEFGANMPGWRIMDNEGNFNYQDKLIKYRYFLEPRRWD